MAEPIGVALGFAGLVGLFTSCVDTFKLVQIYRRRKDDFDVFQTMLDNQQFHLMAWGQACGFMGVEQQELRSRYVLHSRTRLVLLTAGYQGPKIRILERLVRPRQVSQGQRGYKKRAVSTLSQALECLVQALLPSLIFAFLVLDIYWREVPKVYYFSTQGVLFTVEGVIYYV